MTIDRFGRDIHYLRISLTDHCNLRYIYCMPEDQIFHPNPELMQDDAVVISDKIKV
jgi:cyclic pyranopterin phosphate synthase